MASKRRLEMATSRLDQDPDYEVITTPTAAKRQRVQEEDAKEQTIRRIQVVIKKQFNIALENKEKEIELVDERLQKARMQLDKLRACIVARYYGKAGLSAAPGERSKQKLDLSHPAIQRALGHPPKSSTPPPHQDGETNLSRPPSQVGGASSLPESGRSTPIAELLGRSDAFLDLDGNGLIPGPKGPRNVGQDTFGIGPPLENLKAHVYQLDTGEGSRFHVKKRIIVGNVSKYIPPAHREDSDPSTHKWMVYVRGPPDEPRIDHFVEKVWFFLHPSYRPNDLLEVKEPPFHLTRRGWGEFPIRIQLHFKDPRNKKVDIIHHLKLDRTYTGLQTLGAETIVDVELDRYLFNECGDPLSRPSTPTVTKVNYKEGLKPDLSRVPTPIRSTLALGNEESCRRSITSPSPQLLDSLCKTPESTPDRSRPPSRGSTASSPLMKSLTGSNRTTPLSLEGYSNSFKPETDIGGSAAVSLGKLSLKVKAQSGPALLNTVKPVRVMPPLGPISTPLNNKTHSVENPTTQVSPSSVDSLTYSSSLLSGSSNNNPGCHSDVQTVSPTHSGAINVGDMAISSQGNNLIRIQDGQIVQDLPSDSTSPTQAKSEVKRVTALNQAASCAKVGAKFSQTPGTSTPTISLQKIPVPNLPGRPQTILSASNPSVQSTVSISQLAKQPLVGSPLVRKSPAGVTLVNQTPVGVSPSRVGQQSSVMPVIPNPPPGTQYYVTAKSTDKNLQGKVILIPQQVFSQPSSGQAGKSGRGVGRAQSSAKQATGSGSFLSPSNVLILPQGSIVPPLPPGSIVQIQPVPTPTRSAQTGGSAPQMTRIALTQKSGASTIITPKPATQRVASGGGVIQIQRSAGQTLAKLVPAVGAAQQAVPSSSVSLIPEMKGQLARTAAGGVVLVQRTSAASKSSTIQTLSGIQSVISSQTVPVAQKIAINQITGSNVIPSQQKVSLPIKGGTSVLLSQSSRISTSRTVVLQSQAPAISTNSVKTIQVRSDQPAIKTITKIVPTGDDKLGQTSGEPKTLLNVTEISDDDKKFPIEKLHDASSEKTKANSDKGEPPVTGTNHVAQTEKHGCQSGENSTNESSQKGDVQAVESMQTSTPLLHEDVESVDGESSILASGEDGNGGDVDLGHCGHNSIAEMQSSCKVAIKKEPEDDVAAEEPVVIEADINLHRNGVNGHCVMSKAAADATSVESKGSRVKEAACDETSLKSNTGVRNKCVIKVVNAKLQSPVCQASDAPKLGQRRVRVIRIKQEPGTDSEPILAALATAPLVSVGGGQNKEEATIVGTSQEKNDDRRDEGWESRELRDWLRVLADRFEEETNLYGVTSIEQLIKYVAEQAPLIDSTRVQNELPFCATSLDHYNSWSLPKRRSMEWQRAVFVRNKVTRLKAKVPCLRDGAMWSKKKIVMWCRRHGFTPPEPGVDRTRKGSCHLCGRPNCGVSSESPCISDRKNGCSKDWLSHSGILKRTTFSSPEELSRILLDKHGMLSKERDHGDDIEVDIISYGDPSKGPRVKTEADETAQLKCFMPPSEGASYVSDAAQKIGIHFKPVQVGEDTYSPVIQEMIFAATRQFLDDVVRGSLAESYGDRVEHRLPDEILPLHVHRSVASMPSCDFLTNNHLGVVAVVTDDKKEPQ